MKKIILTFAIITGMLISTKAQVLFSGAETLKGGAWNIGLNPVYGDRYDGDFAMFFHGGYGLGKNSDLGLKLGFGWSDTYVGLDYERTFLAGKPSISALGGFITGMILGSIWARKLLFQLVMYALLQDWI